MMPTMRTKLVLAALITLTNVASAQNRAATLVLTNGRIVTVDSSRPEAQAVAIAGDRIIAVGTNAEIQRHVTAATRSSTGKASSLSPASSRDTATSRDSVSRSSSST